MAPYRYALYVIERRRTGYTGPTVEGIFGALPEVRREHPTASRVEVVDTETGEVVDFWDHEEGP